MPDEGAGTQSSSDQDLDVSQEKRVIGALLRRICDKEEGIEGLTKTSLHKLLYMIDKEAEEEGVDAGLDMYWYRYGPVDVAVTEIDTSFGPDQLDSQTKNGNNLYEPTTSTPNRIENDDLSDIIDDVVDQANPYRMDRLRYKIYEQHAPYRFQFVFRYELLPALRTVKDFVSNEQTRLDVFSGAIPEPLKELRYQLQNTQINLPEEEFFEQFNDLYLRFVSYLEDYMAQQGELTVEDVEHFEELADDIWNAFADGLRVKTKQNIEDKQKRLWTQEFYSDIEALLVKIKRLKEETIKYQEIDTGKDLSLAINSYMET